MKEDRHCKELEVVAITIALLARQRYWTEDLWRKLKGRKDWDRAAVHNAFLTLRLRDNLGIYTSTCGCCWTHLWDESQKQFADDYIESYRDIFEDYAKWLESVR